MLTALLTGWLLVLVIQLVYILFIFSRTAFRSAELAATPPANAPGVTIVVCARNEYTNLLDLLPQLDAQVYPLFEVLVMDDRSTDGTQAYLDTEIAHLTHVRSIRIDTQPAHITPKKYAITIAIKKANYPTVLLTDADCRPASDGWLAGMVARLASPEKALVLGFSPYQAAPGLLNLLIRFETLFTAVQYLSLALAGRPYMGVGRNLAYRTQLFMANRGFYSHMNVLGGDDDLFVNEVATATNTTVCLDPDTFMWSIPKETWADWRTQKRRHLNVGKFYRPGNKVRLGLLVGSHVLSWGLAGVAGGLVGAKMLAGWPFTPAEWLLLCGASALFGLRLLLFWGIVGRISYRLAHTVHWLLMPVMDLVLAVYYGMAGLKTGFTRRQKQYDWR